MERISVTANSRITRMKPAVIRPALPRLARQPASSSSSSRLMDRTSGHTGVAR